MTDWVREGVPYWENPDCPRAYLVDCLVWLVKEVEGVSVSKTYFALMSDQDIRQRVEQYEYLSDK